VRRRTVWSKFRKISSDDSFLHGLHIFEGFISRVLSVAMVIVIFAALFDLGVVLFEGLFADPVGRLTTSLTQVFGLFLNVLIALELLENITAYLKKQVVQVELVIVTSLIAVSRKIIILDLEKTAGLNLIALGTTILALSISYWLIRRANRDVD